MRLFGHPVHPMLVAFPLALLTLTPVLDVMAWTGLMADAKVAAYLCELAGLVGAGLSILTGFIDLVKIPSSENATVRAALIHAALALGTVSLFGIAFAVRGGRAASPGVAVLALEAAGAACVAATGWFGGHLVFRYGVGVGAPPKATGPFS